MRLFQRPDGRYYAIFAPHRDLFGDLVCVTVHGSQHSGLGGVKTYYAGDDETHMLRTVNFLVKLRLRHGYVEVE